MNDELFNKIKLISNRLRFKIIELTQDKEYSITELSSKLKLAYNKCSDYVSLLEKNGLVIKESKGKEVLIRSKVRLGKNKVEFYFSALCVAKIYG